MPRFLVERISGIDRPSEAVDVSGPVRATFTSGAYRTRFLTTLIRNNIGATLASNQLTLPAGTYFAQWSCPAYEVAEHQTRLYDATDATVLAYGSSEIASISGGTQTRSNGSAIFTLTSSKLVEVDHRCASSAATDGFGVACNFGNIEVYTELRLWKQ